MAKSDLRGNLKKLLVFEAAARHLHFTRAAEELGLSQPNVSMQVRQLEKDLGIALFGQIGKRLHLTEAGDALFDHCRKISQELQDAEVALARITGLEDGILRLSIGASAKYFMPRVLSVFQERFPGVVVDMEIAGRGSLLSGLEDNERDLVVMGDMPKGAGVVGEALFEDPFVLIAHAGHSLSAKKKIGSGDLRDQKFLMRHPNSETRSVIDAFLNTEDIHPDIVLVTNSNEAIKRGVAAGLGVAFVPRQSVQEEVANGQLAILDMAGPLPHRTWFLVHRENKKFSFVAEAFREFSLEDIERIVEMPRSADISYLPTARQQAR